MEKDAHEGIESAGQGMSTLSKFICSEQIVTLSEQKL